MWHIRTVCLPDCTWKKANKTIAGGGFTTARLQKIRYLAIALAVLTWLPAVATPAAANGVNWSGSLATGPEYRDGTGETVLDNDFRLKLNLVDGESLAGVLLLQYQAQLPVARLTEGSYQFAVNQAYFDFKLPAEAILRIGRQKISWGSGMAWNPTNYLGADKNRTDLNNEYPGVDVLDFEKGIGESALTLLLKPQASPADWGMALKYAMRLGRHDLAVSAFRAGEANGYGIDWAASIAGSTVYSEIAAKTGTGRFYVGEAGGLLTPSTRSGNERRLNGLIGMNRMMPGDWMIQLEYYYNQAGWNRAEAGNYYRYTGPLDFQAASYFGDLCQNYLYTLIRKGELFTDLSAALNILSNLDDGSMMLVPELEYRLKDNITANFTLTWFAGSGASEFGNMADRLQIALKLNVSF